MNNKVEKTEFQGKSVLQCCNSCNTPCLYELNNQEWVVKSNHFKNGCPFEMTGCSYREINKEKAEGLNFDGYSDVWVCDGCSLPCRLEISRSRNPMKSYEDVKSPICLFRLEKENFTKLLEPWERI